jgi:hypothetical protein
MEIAALAATLAKRRFAFQKRTSQRLLRNNSSKT